MGFQRTDKEPLVLKCLVSKIHPFPVIFENRSTVLIMADALISPSSPKALNRPRRVSLDAYFRAEEKATDKHEFHNGLIR